LCAPDRSRSVFARAGEAVYEAQPIATPTIKYDLLKEKMEWPAPRALMSYRKAGKNPISSEEEEV